MDNAQVKGSVLKSRLAFIEKEYGDQAVQKVLGCLDPEDQKILGTMLPVSWIPFEVGKRLDEAIVKELGGGRTEFFERLGAASAETNLSTVHEAFLAPGNPHGFLAKAGQIYRMYYRTGWREYEKTGEKEGVLTTHEAETFSKTDCLTIIGWHKRALELCGVKNPRIVEEECRALGGEVCRYRVSWD